MPGATVVPADAAATLGCVTGGSVASTTAPAGPDPVLGTASWGTPGFGRSRPTTIDYGGDTSSSIHDIRWQSWGGARATGTGRAVYASPTAQTAEGREEQATVVAFDLGTCAGRPAYRKVQWYFPQHGEKLTSENATHACI